MVMMMGSRVAMHMTAMTTASTVAPVPTPTPLRLRSLPLPLPLLLLLRLLLLLLLLLLPRRRLLLKPSSALPVAEKT